MLWHIMQKPVRETLCYEVPTHAAYSPNLELFDYHLFSSKGQALKDQHFKTAEEVEKRVNEWFSSKPQELFWQGIHKLTERWSKYVTSNGEYFE